MTDMLGPTISTALTENIILYVEYEYFIYANLFMIKS